MAPVSEEFIRVSDSSLDITANYLSSRRFIARLGSFANWAEVFFNAPPQSCLLAHFNSVGLLARRKRASHLSVRPAGDLRAYAKQLDPKRKVSPSVGRAAREEFVRAATQRELICEKLRGIKWFFDKIPGSANGCLSAADAARGMNKGIINLL